MLVILPIEVHLDGTLGIDLVNGNLGAVLGGAAVDGRGTRHGTNATNLEGGAIRGGCAPTVVAAAATSENGRSCDSTRELGKIAPRDVCIHDMTFPLLVGGSRHGCTVDVAAGNVWCRGIVFSAM